MNRTGAGKRRFLQHVAVPETQLLLEQGDQALVGLHSRRIICGYLQLVFVSNSHYRGSTCRLVEIAIQRLDGCSSAG
jgi:hypothetical protein